MDMPKILLPAGWTAEQDCRYFVERWEPVPSYSEALWQWMRFHHGVFTQTLDASLDYLSRWDFCRNYVEPRCLTPIEKIAILHELARSCEQVASYRDELTDLLSACEVAERERQRIIPEYRLAGEHAWMYPVIEVIDYLGGSAFHLDELMASENEDYRVLTTEGWKQSPPDVR